MEEVTTQGRGHKMSTNLIIADTSDQIVHNEETEDGLYLTVMKTQTLDQPWFYVRVEEIEDPCNRRFTSFYDKEGALKELKKMATVVRRQRTINRKKA